MAKISKDPNPIRHITHFPPPSPLALGTLYIEEIFREDAKESSEIVINRAISILEITNLIQLKPILTQIFHVLQDHAASESEKSTMKLLIQAIIEKFQTNPDFRPQLISFFDSLQNFPINIIQKLPPESAIVLSTYGCYSKFPIVKTILKTRILPSATKEVISKLSDNVLYEISCIQNDQIISERLKNISTIIPPQKTGSNFIQNETPQLIFEKSDKPSLYDAISESDTRSLTTYIQLNRIFDFYSDFNAGHAALFIVSLSTNKSFRGYFTKLEEPQKDRIIDFYRDSFRQRNVDLNQISSFFDQPNIPSIDNDGFHLLFSIYQSLSKEKILGKSFISEWKNRLAQLQFLTYIANAPITNLSLSADCQMTNLYGYEVISPIPNQCWIWIDYVQAILSLSNQFQFEVTQLLSIASDQYSGPILLTYSQLSTFVKDILTNNRQETPKSQVFTKTALLFLSTTIQTRQSHQVIPILWSHNKDFLCWLFYKYYLQYPNKLNTIIEAIGDRLHELLQIHSDMKFVIDLAFQASLRGLLDIDSFIDQLVKRTSSQDVLNNILEFVKSLVLNSYLSSPALFSNSLNSMFKYFWDHFSELSNDTKLLVNAVYSICDTSVPNIKKIPFSDSLPSIKTPEIKENASELFAQFFTNKITVLQFVQLFHQFRVTSNTLFNSMEHYLLLELKYLDQHDEQDVVKLGQLVGNMARENLFNERQLKYIFQFFIRSFQSNNNVESLNYKFSVQALEICYLKLVLVPAAAFSILKQPLLRNSQPNLYEKVRKLSVNLTTPVQLPKATVLTLHPRLKKFEKLEMPPPRVCKLIQQIPNDPTFIQSIVVTYSQYIEWLALHLVSAVQDRPTLLQTLLIQLQDTPQFSKIVIQAAIFQSIQLITSPSFSTFEGAFARRRLSILGQLIGNLTLHRNKTIPGQYLNLKHLLLYAFSQGKLYGVIPFVSNILCSASPFFNPPNPYTSSILQVLASIAMTDLLKLFIKNQIHQIFNHFNVSISQIRLLTLVPDVRQNNFDFISTPFALNYILSAADIDKLIQFDENVFVALAAQNIVIPDQPNQSSRQEDTQKLATTMKEKIKASLTNATLSFFKNEGTSLSKIASSTAGDIINKYFIMSTNVETAAIQETAAILTKQLAAGLTLFTVFQRLQRSLFHQMAHEFGPSEHDWVNLTIHTNFNWIGQLLHDVVHLKAYKNVQQRIEDIKKKQGSKYPESMLQLQKNFPGSLASNEQGLTQQQLQIYQELAELPLSPAELSIPEVSQDKGIIQIPIFDDFFKQLDKIVATEITSNQGQCDPLAESSTFLVIMSKFPSFEPQFEYFLSLLKLIMKHMNKYNDPINDKIYGYILDHVVSIVPPAFVSRAQSYVNGWLKNSIPSVSLLCDLLNLGLTTTGQLDRLFFDSLNKQPFNFRMFGFVIRFLDTTLAQEKIIPPHEIISSLTLVVSTSYSMFEMSNQFQEQPIDRLKRVLDEMEVPLHVLSPESKLQAMSTFDPLDEITEIEPFLDSFHKWKFLLDDENSTDEMVFQNTKELFEQGRDFFIVVLYHSTKEELSKLLRCAKESGILSSHWDIISSAFEYCIGGNAMVLQYDMTRYFDALIILLNSIYSDIALLNRFANLMHSLRPLLMPAFTFSWIELITDRHLVYGLIGAHEKLDWVAMGTLLADYVVTLAYTADTSPREIFDLIYKSILRFVLVLTHDFPEFVVTVVPEICTILPSNFTQIRNILLSAYPPEIQLIPISKAITSLDKVPGIGDFHQIQVPQKHLIEEMQFHNAIKSELAFSDLATQLDKKVGSGAIASFVVFITNVLLPQCALEGILSPTFTSNHVYFIINQLVRKINADALQVLVNVIIDQLRFPSKTTLFFYKTALALLKNTAKQLPPQIGELIVTTVMERAGTPPPHPWGLRLLIRELMTNEEIRLFERPFVQNSEEVKRFLNAIFHTFCKHE